MTDQYIPTRCINEERLPDDGFDIVELFKFYLIKEQNDPANNIAKPRAFYPSSFGNTCRRALYYHRIGAEHQKRWTTEDLLLFKAGDAYHTALQDLIKDHGGVLIEDRIRIDDIDTNGYVDSVFKTEEWIIEIKSIAESSYNALTKPKEDHKKQAHLYMWAHDIPRAQLVYVNRNTGALRKFKVLFSNETWGEIVEEVNEVDAAVEANEPPPYASNEYTCRKCKFFLKGCDRPAS